MFITIAALGNDHGMTRGVLSFRIKTNGLKLAGQPIGSCLALAFKGRVG